MSNVIHYVDAGEIYSVYGIASMIVIILLIWYFVRSNLVHEQRECHLEGLNGGIYIEDPAILSMMPEFNGSMEFEPIKISPDDKPKPYKMWSGEYGGVPLSVYDVGDVVYKPEWDHNQTMFIPNMRTVFRQTYTPYQASHW